jgi:glycosyltransferase involved in cell wall biosynthesis
LHDYWLECPRFGQLVHADGGICERVVLDRCGTCLASFKWRQTGLERRTGKVLAALRAASGLDLSHAARALAAKVDRRPAPVEPAEAAAYASLAGERASDLRSTVARTVDRFVSPSRFLAERMIAFGLERSRMRVVPTGIDAARFAPRVRERGARLAIRFFGTLVPLKGAHVLLEAWKRLDAKERARGELALFGSQSHAPEYQARLEALAREAGARLGGRLDREGVARELSSTDLCVVPSLWFENRPLIALEALATRTPLLVSDLGGLAELVEDGHAGWRFAVGDAEDLARRLRAVLADPRALDAIRARAREVPSFDETAATMLALYQEVLEEKRA